MAKLSNAIITTLNFLTTILSLLAIGTFIYLHFFHISPTNCQKMIEWPILIIGLILLIISLLGLIGSCCHISSLLWIYLVALVVIIIGWLVFSVFVFFVTNKGAGNAVSGVGFKEYKLGDYNHWLQKHVVDGKNWVKIRSCLVDTKVCGSFHDVVYTNNGLDLLKDKLTPIQSGCCKPPTSCGFTPKNGTYWDVPKTGPASSESDCMTWTNDPNKLCYDCKSCKAGVLANLRKEWRHFLIFNVIILAILFLIYMIGCCAVRNSHNHSKHPLA
ncbi:Tetraspanin-8 [Bienertia sinuspersici]